MIVASRTEFLAAEFESIQTALAEKLSLLQGKTLLITGATGFFGKWLTSALSHLAIKNDLDLKIIAVSRDSRAFLETFPFLPKNAPIQWVDADLSSRTDLISALPPKLRCDFIIHAATPAHLGIYENQPVEAYRTMIAGTENTLEIARAHGSRFLFTSSGAVYGKQPSAMTHVTEDFTGAPPSADYRNIYGEGKRINETLCAAYGHQHKISYVIARCFAFVGPFLPLDQHFAVGNFINDCLHGRPITIQGDGTPYRSYLYGTDLVIGLLTLLLSSQNGGVYNLGSDESVSIQKLAEVCTAAFDHASEIKILTPLSDRPPARYVPSIEKIKKDLAFQVRVPLAEAISRTRHWYELT